MGNTRKESKKLEQVIKIRSHLGKCVVKHGQVEQCKQEIEQRARWDLVEKLR